MLLQPLHKNISGDLHTSKPAFKQLDTLISSLLCTLASTNLQLCFFFYFQPAADIVLSPPPVQPRSLPLHSSMEQHQRQRVAEGLTAQLAGVRLDLEGEGGVAASSSKPIWMPSLAQASQSTIQSRSKVSVIIK